jgi:hypothetical protein
MKILSSSMMAAVMALVTVAPAQAVTITFEGQFNTIYNAPITRSGFDFGNVAGDEQHFHEIDSTQFGLPSNGTGILLNDRNTRIFSRANDLSDFTLGSVDVATATNNSPATSLKIYGYLNDVLVGTLTVDPLSGWQTIAGGSLGTIDYLVFDGEGGGGGFVLDNAVFNEGGVGGIPEPATWAMMIAGFGLVGATMRRRRSVAVSA